MYLTQGNRCRFKRPNLLHLIPPLKLLCAGAKPSMSLEGLRFLPGCQQTDERMHACKQDRQHHWAVLRERSCRRKQCISRRARGIWERQILSVETSAGVRLMSDELTKDVLWGCPDHCKDGWELGKTVGAGGHRAVSRQSDRAALMNLAAWQRFRQSCWGREVDIVHGRKTKSSSTLVVQWAKVRSRCVRDSIVRVV